MPFRNVKPITVRGVYFPLPVLSPQGWLMAAAMAEPLPGEPACRQVAREAVPPGTDPQDVIDDLARRLDELDPPKKRALAIA